MRRRNFIAAGAAAITAGLAGCGSDSDGEQGTTTGTGTEATDTLSVATYTTFVDAPSDSPGDWIEQEFERRHDIDFEWVVPDQPINHYIERHNQGVDIDAEVYLGIKPNELVRADENTDGELFQPVDRSQLENAGDIDEQFYFDPQDRMVPSYASYASLVYDGTELENPGTFDALLEDQYEGMFGVPNPTAGNTGLYFLLWTIEEFGEDGEYTYLDYWNDLLDNDTRVVESWGTMYGQFSEGEIPMVFSYSNDQVYAQRSGADLDKHQVGFLNGQGYANLSAMGRFSAGTDDENANRFIDFILDPEVQAKIAELNVTGPVNPNTELPDVYEEYAQIPDDIVFFDYERLSGNLDSWTEEWQREVVSN